PPRQSAGRGRWGQLRDLRLRISRDGELAQDRVDFTQNPRKIRLINLKGEREQIADPRRVLRFAGDLDVPFAVSSEPKLEPLLHGFEGCRASEVLVERPELGAKTRELVSPKQCLVLTAKGPGPDLHVGVHPVPIPVVRRLGKLSTCWLHADVLPTGASNHELWCEVIGHRSSPPPPPAYLAPTGRGQPTLRQASVAPRRLPRCGGSTPGP